MGFVPNKQALDMIKIETYWNVNETGRNEIIEDMTIKIETYWNVNEYVTLGHRTARHY